MDPILIVGAGPTGLVLAIELARRDVPHMLIDQRPNPIKVLLQKTETAEVKLANNDPPAMAEATRAAIAEVLRRSEADIAAALR